MKKVLFYIGILCLLMAGTAFAETYDPLPCLYVSSPDANGVVVVKGDPSDMRLQTTLEQYKPDKFKGKDIMRNTIIEPFYRTNTEAHYQLNMARAKRGQRAYQLHFGDLWLLLPNPKVVVGANTVLDHSDPSSDSKTGGAHFVYTPAIP